MAEGKSGAGRHSSLTELSDASRDIILREIQRGASSESAAAMADIHERTFYRWLEKGKAGREPYAQFASDVEVAKRAWQRDCETAISSSPDWRARAWMLERRRRKEYGNEVKVDVNTTPVEELTIERLTAIAAGSSAGNSTQEGGTE
jgi:transposase